MVVGTDMGILLPKNYEKPLPGGRYLVSWTPAENPHLLLLPLRTDFGQARATRHGNPPGPLLCLEHPWDRHPEKKEECWEGGKEDHVDERCAPYAAQKILLYMNACRNTSPETCHHIPPRNHVALGDDTPREQHMMYHLY